MFAFARAPPPPPGIKCASTMLRSGKYCDFAARRSLSVSRDRPERIVEQSRGIAVDETPVGRLPDQSGGMRCYYSAASRLPLAPMLSCISADRG